jgi:aldose 1-epimerase
MSEPATLRLASDELEVELLPEIGGRLHRLRAFGTDLLATPDDPAAHRREPVFWGAYVMAPWCNRAVPGPTTVLGEPVDLDANFSDGTAIHGLVAGVPWTSAGDGRLSVNGGGDGHWPWPFSVHALVAVDGVSLTLDYRLRNRSDRPMPAGIGLHPWFRQPLELRVPAASVFRANTDSPSDAEPVAGVFDLRAAATPAAGLDATWADLAEPVIELGWPALGLRARMTITAPTLHVAVATPDREAWAVEPQTHAPDPLRRLRSGEPGPPAVLGPDEELRLALRLTVDRA